MNRDRSEKELLRRDLLFLLLKLGILAGFLFLLFRLVFGLARETDLSMAPAVKDGDLVLFYRLDRTYARGDTLVLKKDGELEIRRVAAVAGDTVDISGEGLKINGALQQEKEILEETRQYEEGISFPVTLREGEVFLLGDGREHSADSRVYGPVPERDTEGTVIALFRRRGI